MFTKVAFQIDLRSNFESMIFAKFRRQLRTSRDGRTDPAGPLGTDGRTKIDLKNLSLRYCFQFLTPPNPLDPFLKGLFNKEFLINRYLQLITPPVNKVRFFSLAYRILGSKTKNTVYSSFLSLTVETDKKLVSQPGLLG